MKIYLPTYSDKKEVVEIESEKAKIWHFSSGSVDIIYNGIIYNGKNIFKNERGAWAYWNWDFDGMRENRLQEEEITFQGYKNIA